jgi:hypothetical protein
MILPAISIKEPWASMIAHGEKTIEVRSWKTSIRGRIVICASKSPDGPLSGNAFAVAEIAEIRELMPEDAAQTGGFYEPGLFAWVLQNVRRCRPFPISGMPGIFKIDTTAKKRV